MNNTETVEVDGWRVLVRLGEVSVPVRAADFFEKYESGIWACDFRVTETVADIRVDFVERNGSLQVVPIVLSEVGSVDLPADFDLTLDNFVSGGVWIPLRESHLKSLRSVMQVDTTFADFPVTARFFFDAYPVLTAAGIQVSVPENFADLLRSGGEAVSSLLLGEPYDYQRIGIGWLTDFYDSGLGAVLADEMGLGKTYQVLGLVAHVLSRGEGPVLIVCPNTLTANWLREFEKFLPNFQPLLHHGVNRIRRIDRQVESWPVVVTTYNLLINDLTEFSRVPWSLVVCDEAQALKNRKSLTRRSVKALNAEVKTLVTGTPFENSLKDVWSLIDIVNDGLLGDPVTFERKFLDLPHYARDLGQFVGPMIMRRQVTQVLKDLPPILEFDVAFEPSAMMSRVYEERRAQGVSKQPPEGFLELSGSLRRICASLTTFDQRLVDPDDAKIARLFEILDELYARDEDKVLIFSNWVESIRNIAQRVADRYGSERVGILWGESTDRQEIVDGLNESIGFRVLVVNPQVGGVGLNIVGANHVIHFDRLWNPMLEMQATRRAWRIGQNKPVFVHKFYYKDTIEDIVQMRLETKRKLASGLLEQAISDEEQAMQSRARLISPLNSPKNQQESGD